MFQTLRDSFGRASGAMIFGLLLSFATLSVASADKLAFHIDAQDASTALTEFGRQSQTQILFAFELVKGLTTQAVIGDYELTDAIGILLDGTGLQASPRAGGVLVVEPIGAHHGAANPSSAMQFATANSATDSEMSAAGSAKESEKSFWDRIRLAQNEPASPSDRSSSGDEKPSQDSGKSSDQQTLEEIVVTAQKREERLKDVPISITVLNGENLDHSTAQGIAEELTRVPGVSTFAHTQAGGTVVTVRGASAGSPVYAGSSPVSYYLDSVPFGLVQSAIAPDASAYDLARVEVLRGPQGTLYGANAQAGVVRILTKDPDLNQFEVKMRASDSGTDGGSNNFRGDVAVNAPIVEGKLAVRAVLGYQDQSGWIDTPLKNNANDAQLRNARVKIGAQPTSELSIVASAWISRGDYGGLSASDDNARRTTAFDESYSIDYDAYGVKVGYEFQTFSFTSMTSYLDYSSGGITDSRGIFGSPVALLVSFDADVVSEEINFASTRQGPWRWTAGAMYRDGKDRNFADATALGVQGSIITLDWTNRSKSYAAFGELSRRFYNDKLEWTLGVRSFHDDVLSREDHVLPPINPPNYYRAEDSFNSTTPRAVLTWHPTTALSFYGSYSEGFRSGTPQSYYTVGGVPGFPPAKPDKLHNYEIGTKGGTSRLGFEAAVYYMDWKDVQQSLTVVYHGAPVSAIVNGESASGVGVDLGVTARPLPGLEVGANVSWNDLTMDADILSAGAVLFAKGDRPNFSPEYTAALFADYAFPLGGSGFKGRLSASGNYSSEQTFRGFSGPVVVPAAGDPILVARAAFSIQSPNHWDLTIFGDNLNNEKGAVVGNPFFGADASARVRPRTVGVQMDYSF
jgi:iron complex outermembrane receptor protein